MIKSLNQDQLKALAKLFFDLSKAAFILAVLAPLSPTTIASVVSGLRSYLVGLAFTYLGLLLLGIKETAK